MPDVSAWAERSQEALDRRDRVVAGHQCLADEHDIRSGRAVVGDVRGFVHGRFGDPDDARRDAVGERPEQIAVELEGAEVARVDADDRGADIERALDLFGRMRLDERRHAELDDQLVEFGEQRLLERGDDEQHEVRARGACLEDLVRLGDEVFAQHGDLDGGAHLREVVERSAEAAPLGQHADRARSAGLVRDARGRPGRGSRRGRRARGSRA